MKHLRKRLLTLLALTLFGGMGAWAQGPTQVTQITTDLIASWANNENDVTLADLQALGFVAVDASVAAAWTGAPQGDYSWLIYGFDAGDCNYIMFDDSGDPGNPSYSSYTKGYLYYMVSDGYKFFYTGAPNPEPAEIGPTTVFEVDFSSTVTVTTGSMRIGTGITSPSSVRIHNNTDLIRAIQIGGQYGYSSNWYFSIKPATGSFKKGDTLLIAVCYNNSGTKTAQADIYAANRTTLLFTTAPGINGKTESGDPVVEKFVLGQDADSLLFGGSSSSNDHTYVTTLKVLRPAAIELTPNATGKVWTLAETPDYDLELQVEYYDEYTLDSIPLGWQVKVGNAAPVYPTAYTEGNTSLGHLTITETDSVELIPPAEVKPNVKSVTLVEPVAVQTVIIGGVTLQVVPGETWEAIVDRNSGVIIKDGSMIMRWSDGWYLIAGGNWVNTSDPYNSTANYSWEAMW